MRGGTIPLDSKTTQMCLLCCVAVPLQLFDTNSSTLQLNETFVPLCLKAMELDKHQCLCITLLLLLSIY